MGVRTIQYVDLISREPVHDKHNLEIEFVQGQLEVDYKRVEKAVVIRKMQMSKSSFEAHDVR